MPAMLGCSTTCPKCQHQFACCPPTPPCGNSVAARRSLHVLSGGGLITTAATTMATLPPTPMLVAPSTTVSSSSSCPSPQISPSVPLAFVLPTFAPAVIVPAVVPLVVHDPRPEADLKRLSDIVRALRLSDWYYEGISYQRSQELLKDKSIGTFLVRDSSDPHYLFSLSVQTERGPTSVRLHYANGYFRLDAQSYLQSTMPLFPSVVELIEYYVAQCRALRGGACGGGGSQVWVDAKGKVYSSIFLDKPLRKTTDAAPSLKHLARLAVHRAIQRSGRPRLSLLPPAYTQLELPKSVTNYLAEYPYSI